MAAKRPPLVEETRRPFLDVVQQHRKSLVAVAVLLAIVVFGVVLYVTQRARTEREAWGTVLSANRLNDPTGDLLSTMLGGRSAPDLETLERLSGSAHQELMPYVLYQLAHARALAEDYEGALDAIERLRSEFGDTPFSGIPSPDSRYSLTGYLKSWIEREQAWSKSHAFEAPEVDTKQIALVETEEHGAFWIGFYPGLAAKHVGNFISLAKSGAFNGISVTELATSHVRFGGEASKDDDPKNDDEREMEGLLSAEKGRYRIPMERGAVSSVAVDGGESPTRFDVVTERRPLYLDKTQTIFGRVLTDRYPNMIALDRILNVETYGKSKDERIKDNPDYTDLQDHPIKTVRVLRVSIWAGGKIADGHDWDTTEVALPDEAKDKAAAFPVKDEGDEKPSDEADDSGSGEEKPGEAPEDKGSEKEESGDKND